MCKKVGVSSTGTQTCAVCITTLTLTYKKRSEQRQKSFISLPCLRKDPPYSGLCSGTVQWPLAVYFYYWATRKSWLFHRNPMLGSLDFPGSEHLVPLNFFFLRAQPWHFWFGFLVLIWFGWEFFSPHLWWYNSFSPTYNVVIFFSPSIISLERDFSSGGQHKVQTVDWLRTICF